MLLPMLCAAVALAAPARGEGVLFYREEFEGPVAPEIYGAAAVVPARDGHALRLERDASMRIPARRFAKEAGRVDLDVALHAPIAPRTDQRHAMLMTDVGAGAAWRGATVVYWDSATAVLSWGVYDGGWRWLRAERAEWRPGVWHHMALEWGPSGRMLEIDGTVIARDDYGRGIDPRDRRIGRLDAHADAAPVLVDNLRATAFPLDMIRLSSAVVCPYPDGVLDGARVEWSIKAPGIVSIALARADGSVVKTIVPPTPAPADWLETGLSARGVPSGAYRVRLTVQRPGEPVVSVDAPLTVSAELRWRPARNRMGERFPLGVWYFWEEDASYINQHVQDAGRARAYYERTMADLRSLDIDTVVANWTPRDHRRIMLDAAQRNGVRAIVHLDEVNAYLWDHARFASGDILRDFTEAVATARDHPATLGYYLVDEPSPTPENRNAIETAKKLVEAIDPAHPGFSCLLGDYAALYRQVGYHVLLVDIYPVYASRLEGATLDGFIAAVDRAREVARGGPVWVIPQCFGFGKPAPRGIPTPNEVSLMVWEAIAHGAKGIIYFIYQSTTGIQGEWLQGIVDMKLSPMDHRYEEVRRINAAVKPIAGTLLGLTWDGDARASVSPKTVDAQAFRAADGTRYLCLVNQDTHSAVSASVKTPSLTDAATGAAVVPARVELGPGEGRLLRLGAR